MFASLTQLIPYLKAQFLFQHLQSPAVLSAAKHFHNQFLRIVIQDTRRLILSFFLFRRFLG
jgi:hypothetical protein